MKFGLRPQNLIERILLGANLVPAPLADTLVGMWLARSLMTASQVGLFDALAGGALTVAEVADRCGTHRDSTEKLLNAMVGAGYLRYRGGRYRLTRVSRKWLLGGAPRSLHDHMRMMFLAWRWVEGSEDYVRNGKGLRVHEHLTGTEWDLYQRGMRSLAGVCATEFGWRTPVPKGARSMLDLGGSHGHFSVALCRRHPLLRSTIVDLGDAIEKAAPVLAAEGMGDRVVHRAGDARTEDFGADRYDVILVANLLHHFDVATNVDLVRRLARALRPGGVLVLQEVLRVEHGGRGQPLAALGDLYFGMLSAAGTLSFEQMADWQRRAGLVPRRPLRLMSLPGTGQQSAIRPR